MYILRKWSFVFYEDDFGGQVALYLNISLFSPHEPCIALESCCQAARLVLRPAPNAAKSCTLPFDLGNICESFQRIADTELVPRAAFSTVGPPNSHPS